MKQILLKAGYSEESAEQQSIILAGIRKDPQMKPLVQRIEALRDRMLQELEQRVEQGRLPRNFGELRGAFGDFLKHGELLGGRPTERFDVTIDPERKKKIDDILKENS